MITLNYMKWNNFFSYGEGNHLQLDAEPVRQLIAGNGAGKTSILLILEELLYGKNHKGVKKAELSNRYVKSKAVSGEVKFTKGTDVFKVYTSRSPSLKVSLTKNAEDISRHTGAQTFKLIEEILGISYVLFNQLTYLSTDSKLKFLTDTDTERKRFLVKLFQLDSYLDTHEKFKDMSRSIDGALKETIGAEITLSKLISSETVASQKSEEELLEVPEPLVSARQPRIESDILNIKNLNAKTEKNNSYVKILDSLDTSILNSPPEERTQYAVSNLQGDLKTAQAKITQDTATIKKIERLRDKCPTCFSTINKEGVASLKAQAATRVGKEQVAVEALTKEIEAEGLAVSNYAKYIQVSTEFERLTNIIDTEMPQELLDKSKLDIQLKDIKHKISLRNQDIEATKAANSSKQDNNYRIKAAKESIAKYKTQLIEKTQKLKEFKSSLGVANTLKDIFSTKGLLSFKLQYLVIDLEKQINTYLAELSKGRFLLNFALIGDKLNVVITDNGNEIDIASLSTGELGLVEVATLLAVRKLMSSISGTSVNLLFLDEIISVLENDNKEAVLELLSKEQSLHILVVSHNYAHPLIPKLNIYKKDNISKVEEF